MVGNSQQHRSSPFHENSSAPTKSHGKRGAFAIYWGTAGHTQYIA